MLLSSRVGFDTKHSVLRTALVLLVVVFAAAFASPKYERLRLFELAACADLVVAGRIELVSSGEFVASVEQPWLGEPSTNVVRVNAFENWTCAARWAPYRVGQRVVLFLRKPEHPGDPFTILGAGDEGELPILDGKACVGEAQSYRVRDVEHRDVVIDGATTRGYLLPLDAFRDAVRGFRETFSYSATWKRDPVEWIRPTKGLPEAEAFAATGPIARHLFEEARASRSWKGETGERAPNIFPADAKRISATAHGLTGPSRVQAGRNWQDAQYERFSAFGQSCAFVGDIDGDGNEDLAVGAPSDSLLGHFNGALWIVFLDAKGNVRKLSEIREHASGFPAIMNEFSALGRSVTSLGDLDGDGVPDLAVGAPLWDGPDKHRGGVWILFLTRSGEVSHAVEIGSDPRLRELGVGAGSGFGASLANLGDIDGDGSPEIAVGQDPEFDKGFKEGRSVFVVSLGSKGDIRWARRIHDRTEMIGPDYSWFGQAVAGIGDLDGDGIPDLAVSNEYDADGSEMAGAVWICFLDKNGSLKAKEKISAWQGKFGGLLHGGSKLGSPLCGPGDIDGDGIPDLLAGSADGIWVLEMNRDGSVKEQRRVVRSEASPIWLGMSIAARRGPGPLVRLALGDQVGGVGEHAEPVVWLASIDSKVVIRGW